ncbi:MAG: tripartite tricarboxylate transporter permease [Nocardioidaceae bacterium]
MLDAAGAALVGFLDPTTLLMLLIGVVAGLLIGVIPGLGGTGSIALLLPFIFVLDAEQAMALLIGAVAVVHTSDTITSVLLGVPSSAPSTVTVMDAHAMAKQGQGARALSIAFLSAMGGGLLGAIGLTLSIPLARPLVLSFGAPELFMLTVLGVALTALLSRGNLLKGIGAGTLGLLLGTVGTAPAVADYRYNFGTIFLTDGISLVAFALGVYGLAEIAHLVGRRSAVAEAIDVGGGWREGVRDVRTHWFDVVRGSLIGMWAGVLPGLGATAGGWMAYGQTYATAKDKKRFGKGHPRGIVAPEAANNSCLAGDLVPTLLFGIPGAASAALLLGALLFYGVQPGPRIITDDLDLMYTIIYSFALASVVGAALCFPLTRPLAKISRIRFQFLSPALIVIMLMASFQQSTQALDLAVMLLLGVVGWVMKGTGFPRAPLLIGFVLAIPLERYYYLTDSLFTTREWMTRPLVLGMFAILAAPLLVAVLRRVLGRAKSTGGADDEDAQHYEGTLWPVGFSLALVVVFAGALVLAQDFQERARLLPNLVGVIGLACAVVAASRELLRLRGVDIGGTWDERARQTARAFVWIGFYIGLLFVVGMPVATAIFVPIFLLVVARARFVFVAVYTTCLVGGLLLAQAFANVQLPLGMYGDVLVFA